MNLNLKEKKECRYDAVSLGEIMLRLDPGEGRIRTARSFRAWEGGGEYNVVRGLRKCFKLNTGVITAFADNEVGMLMEDLLLGVLTVQTLQFPRLHQKILILIIFLERWVFAGCIQAVFMQQFLNRPVRLF